MRINISLSVLLIAFVLATFGLNAQGLSNSKLSRIELDTIVVYDTVFVTDTVRVYKPLKKIARIEQLPANPIGTKHLSEQTETKRILVISQGFAATISTNDILDSVQIIHLNKSESMKKLSFFGVVLFAFQNMVLAQNHVSLQIGAGAYLLPSIEVPRVNSAPSLERANPAPSFVIGLGYGKSMRAGKMRFNIDLNYHYKLKTNTFPSSYVPSDRWEESRTARYTKPFHMINLPVSIQWNKKLFSPFIGVSPYFETTIFTNTVTAGLGLPVASKNQVDYYGAELFAGVEIPITNRWQARIAYYQSMVDIGWDVTTGKTPKRVEVKLNYRLWN